MQYEVIFSDTFISESDAESRLAYAASKSASETPIPNQDTTGELAQRDGSSTSNPNTQDSNSADAIETYETMILHDKRYLCSIPRVPPPPQNETTPPPSNPSSDAQELARASSRGWELLQDMEGHCLYFISGWWSYSFCYNSLIKQFHQLPPTAGTPPYPPLEDPSTPSYILGQYRDRTPDASTPRPRGPNALAETTPRPRPPAGSTALHSKASKRYLSQTLSGGSPCDLTGRPRRVEIQFHCQPQTADRIGWIQEVSTCAYVMVVYTARLCQEVAFLPPREHEARGVVCAEVVAAEGVGAWEAGRAAGELGRGEGGAEEAPPLVVGGIVVGGMRLVGTEGRRLATGTAPRGGEAAPQSDEAELVARMRPREEGGKVQMVGDEELKEMGFRPEEVQALLEEMQAVAEGNGWRVELVDVGGGGRELRGVVEVEDEEEEGEGEGDGDGGDGGSEEAYYRDEL